MGKRAPARPTAMISRSGLWLIGGTLLFSVAVLAWALQGEPPAHPRRPLHRPAPVERATTRATVDPPEATGVREATRPPAVSDYLSLLQGNAFKPRVVPHQGQSAGTGGVRASAGARAKSAKSGSHSPKGPVNSDDWRGWIYNGLAQIDQQAYASMDQPNKKQSRIVKVGDRLEDATVARVAENEVTLREPDGSITRVQRMDAMAALLKPSPTSPMARGVVPGSTGPPSLPSAPPAGTGPLTTAPFGQTAPSTTAATTGADSFSQGGFGGGRRGRRFQSQDGAGSPGG